MRIAGLDIETTGLDQAKGDRIIELALDIRTETGAPIGKWAQRVNPMRGIDPKAQAVHGIALDQLIGEPTWEVVAPKVQLLLSKCDVVVAHNGFGFDLPFVKGELERVGLTLPKLRLTDTMLQGRWATPDGAVPNLAKLCWACGVDYDKSKAHAADYDVAVMLDCFFRQWPAGFFTIPEHYFGEEP